MSQFCAQGLPFECLVQVSSVCSREKCRKVFSLHPGKQPAFLACILVGQTVAVRQAEKVCQ